MSQIDRYVEAIHNPSKEILDAMEAIDKEEAQKALEKDEKANFDWATI